MTPMIVGVLIVVVYVGCCTRSLEARIDKLARHIDELHGKTRDS